MLCSMCVVAEGIMMMEIGKLTVVDQGCLDYIIAGHDSIDISDIIANYPLSRITFLGI